MLRRRVVDWKNLSRSLATQQRPNRLVKPAPSPCITMDYCTVHRLLRSKRSVPGSKLHDRTRQAAALRECKAPTPASRVSYPRSAQGSPRLAAESGARSSFETSVAPIRGCVSIPERNRVGSVLNCLSIALLAGRSHGLRHLVGSRAGAVAH